MVEVQHSNITIKEIKERTKEYNDQNIYVLWILHGKGKCVASKKSPEDQKNLKISSVEKYLHQMYGGRVYYINLNFYGNQTKITPPFALHYSISDDFPKTAFYRNFRYYYIRNANLGQIPSWKLLCSDFVGYKIARFYDKNVKNVLKKEIESYIKVNKKKKCNNCSRHFKKLRNCRINRSCKFKPRSDKKLLKGLFSNYSSEYSKKFISILFSEAKEKLSIY